MLAILVSSPVIDVVLVIYSGMFLNAIKIHALNMIRHDVLFCNQYVKKSTNSVLNANGNEQHSTMKDEKKNAVQCFNVVVDRRQFYLRIHRRSLRQSFRPYCQRLV
jgi:hypothetical protein